ncbi:hypothetical protein NLM33_41915 [Bradyrhizobium sp. CCGUVB1N3]|uniref:hypothetical protein n=1 Tax=Bradyrhizobium sp. CCGUVB1N3 TaxID=2949629 RepID=UPI0020B21274|nr:hypothetical protein [Bradyrhizobium sp. CCGUVB1N3]MCP3476722.1 hypothetical protein [Bradyrhizobium sp. CCGUVB1N3]
MPDRSFDIGAYRLAAERIPHRMICCFNTFTEIESDNWLAKLNVAMTDPSIGIAGGTASYESFRQSLKAISKTVWFAIHGAPVDEEVTELWGHEIKKHQPNIASPIYGADAETIEAEFERAWSRNNPPEVLAMPGYPNPNIRSNGFMMARQDFLDFTPEVIATKEQTYGIESGSDSLTARIVSRGQRAVVIGANGQIYDQPDWPSSDTFRKNGQRNKLFSDNQTREYDKMNQARKRLMEQWSWGDEFVEIKHISRLPNWWEPLPFSPQWFT